MIKNPGRTPCYKAYWLRCWQVEGSNATSCTSWRLSLEDPENGRKRGFNNMQELVVFLESELSRINQGSGKGADVGDL